MKAITQDIRVVLKRNKMRAMETREEKNTKF